MFLDSLKLKAKRAQLALIEKELNTLSSARERLHAKEKELHAKAKALREEIREELELVERLAKAKEELVTHRNRKAKRKS